ncbi:MAG: hypothetical protein GF308_01885 [Candidatus Heimdallarchaeota archaeon]|nr:hypothetical protein [Candidatus Heimdallarchaeota archaeon]
MSNFPIRILYFTKPLAVMCDMSLLKNNFYQAIEEIFGKPLTSEESSLNQEIIVHEINIEKCNTTIIEHCEISFLPSVFIEGSSIKLWMQSVEGIKGNILDGLIQSILIKKPQVAHYIWKKTIENSLETITQEMIQELQNITETNKNKQIRETATKMLNILKKR